jgi:DNA (cytosine-5)-methyltransferase 1
MKPRLLDLFCGAGGCTKGYQRAGFYVVGVDVRPQPNYCGDAFAQMDALEALERIVLHGEFTPAVPVCKTLGDFDAIHASPPCQGYSVANNVHKKDHPRLLEDVRAALRATGLPYVIENVEGARKEMVEPYTICGLSLGLNVKRHRLFETNFPLMVPACHSKHAGDWLLVFGHSVMERGSVVRKTPAGHNTTHRRHTTTARGREAMGIDWMNRDELSEAIPPAYTELIGHQLMQHVRAPVSR